MKKLFALMLLAAMPLLTMTAEAKDEKFDPEFGYFSLAQDQCVLGCFFPVSWENAGSVNSDDIFIDSSNPDRITLRKKGYYLVTYTITGELKAPVSVAATPEYICPKFQFALYLNEGDQPIPGSTYAGSSLNIYPPAITQTPGEGLATEIVGQVIFRVNDRDSFIQLVNQSENPVDLDAEAGTDNIEKFGNNVSASIAIQRISSLHID